MARRANKSVKSHTTKAVVALIISALAYASLSVGSRLLAEGFAPMTQVYVRLLLATLLFAVVFYKQLNWNIFTKVRTSDWIVLLLMGTLGYGIAVYFITLASLNTSLINLTVIFSSAPFFTYLYSLIFGKAKLSLGMFGVILVSFYGVAVIATGQLIPAFASFGQGEFYAILAAAAFAIYYAGRQFISNDLNNFDISFLTLVIAALCSLLVAAYLREPITFESFTIPAVWVGLLIGVGLNIATTLFINYGFEHLPAAMGNQLLLLENVFAPILGYLLYSEIFTPVQLAGCAVVLAAVFVSMRIKLN